MINSYELRKIYIAELGFDPYLQMQLRSKNKLKNATKTIKEIKSTHTDSYEAENALVQIIQNLSNNSRQKEYAGILLQMGFEENVLSGKAYDYLRSKLGVTEYDDETKEKVKQKWMREYEDNPFGLLEGNTPLRVEQF